MFTSNGPSTRRPHKKESSCFHVQTDLSNSAMFLNRHAAKCTVDTQMPQNSTRPDTIWPEQWPRLSKKPRPDEIAAWDDEQTRLQEVRRKRGNFDVPSEDIEYLKVISEARAKLERYVVPSMPCIPKDDCSGKPDATPTFKCSGNT